jgi:hypothetical protein
VPSSAISRRRPRYRFPIDVDDVGSVSREAHRSLRRGRERLATGVQRPVRAAVGGVVASWRVRHLDPFRRSPRESSSGHVHQITRRRHGSVYWWLAPRRRHGRYLHAPLNRRWIRVRESFFVGSRRAVLPRGEQNRRAAREHATHNACSARDHDRGHRARAGEPADVSCRSRRAAGKDADRRARRDEVRVRAKARASSIRTSATPSSVRHSDGPQTFRTRRMSNSASWRR